MAVNATGILVRRSHTLRMGESDIDLGRIYAEAKTRKNVSSWAGLARLLSVRPQVIQHWKDRGVPMDKLLFIQERIGCPLEAILRNRVAHRIEAASRGTIEEADLTPEENALIAYFRRTDQRTRDALFALIPGLLEMVHKPSPRENVVNIKRKRE